MKIVNSQAVLRVNTLLISCTDVNVRTDGTGKIVSLKLNKNATTTSTMTEVSIK